MTEAFVDDQTRAELPPVGTVVEVTDPAGQAHRTRVEAVGDQTLEVVAPTGGRRRREPPDPGARIDVRWGSQLGMLVARCELVAIPSDVVALWSLAVRRLERHQRRDAYRLHVRLPAELRLVGGDTVLAETLDVSESGVAVEVAPGSHVAVGDRVDLALALTDGVEVLTFAVVRRADAQASEGLRAALELTDPDARTRDVLRRFVLDEQLRRRARGGGWVPSDA